MRRKAAGVPQALRAHLSPGCVHTCVLVSRQREWARDCRGRGSSRDPKVGHRVHVALGARQVLLPGACFQELGSHLLVCGSNHTSWLLGE